MRFDVCFNEEWYLNLRTFNRFFLLDLYCIMFLTGDFHCCFLGAREEIHILFFL